MKQKGPIMAEKMTENTDLLMAQAKTPLALVNDFFLSGHFPLGPKIPVREEEIVIGELSPFEKALYCAGQQSTDDYNTVFGANANSEFEEETARCLLKKQREICSALESLLRASIFERVGYQFAYANRIGLREGYKIVKIPDRDVPIFKSRFDGS